MAVAMEICVILFGLASFVMEVLIALTAAFSKLFVSSNGGSEARPWKPSTVRLQDVDSESVSLESRSKRFHITDREPAGSIVANCHLIVLFDGISTLSTR